MGNGMLSLSKGMNIFGSKPNDFVIYEYKESFQHNNKKAGQYRSQ